LIVSSSVAAASNAGVAVLLSRRGTGFNANVNADAIVSPAIDNTGLQDIVVTDVNQDGRADVVVTTQVATQSGSIRPYQATADSSRSKARGTAWLTETRS